MRGANNGLPMTCSLRMSDGERARLGHDGYVLRNKVFDAGQCGAIIAACEKLAVRLSAKGQGRKLRLGGYTLEFKMELGVIAKWSPNLPIC